MEDSSTSDDRELEGRGYSPSNFNNLPPDCIICQSKPISHALLPCRHTCVCGSCYMKLEDRCPMCRCKITSYFCISNDETLTQQRQEVVQPHRALNRLQQFNNQISQRFGFTWNLNFSCKNILILKLIFIDVNILILKERNLILFQKFCQVSEFLITVLEQNSEDCKQKVIKK